MQNCDQLAVAREALLVAQHVLVLTGAGISAESGVPTFRGPGGYWRNRHYMELACPEAFAKEPELVWEWYCERRRTVADCQPNVAHTALATWAKSRSGVTLVTQNVDGLHERAGHPDVVRMHGSLWKNRCTACDAEREVSDLFYEQLPVSPCCQARERPAIVWFGEYVPIESIRRAKDAVITADLVLVIGTSGVVYPSASFVEAAHKRGTCVIEVNPEGSSLPFDHLFRMPAGEAIPALLAA